MSPKLYQGCSPAQKLTVVESNHLANHIIDISIMETPVMVGKWAFSRVPMVQKAQLLMAVREILFVGIFFCKVLIMSMAV